MKRGRRAIAILLLCAATGAGAAVFRCDSRDGRVTYQDSPCDGAQSMQATNIPTEFPPPNEAERVRILQREAELEQRLELRRERESREASMRVQAAPAPPPEPAQEAYPLYFPIAMPRAHSRHASHGAPDYPGRVRPVTGPIAPRP